MPRPASTADAFTAIAEPTRREILELLTEGELPVNDVVSALGIAQPQVSKHLRVLREVGLVHVREEGRNRLYSVNARRLKPVYEWTSKFERFWDSQLARIKARAEAANRAARDIALDQ